MIVSPVAKRISARIRANGPQIWHSIRGVVEQSVINNNEVSFIVEFAKQLKPTLETTLKSLGVTCEVRSEIIHQKPIVSYQNGAGAQVRCELGDLLMVVKYLGPGGPETKSIVHQVKMADLGTVNCHVNAVQLELLRDWPAFQFGHAAYGGPQTFQINPWTLELGTYSLMLRRPSPDQHQQLGLGDYGISPSAWTVHSSGPLHVVMTAIPFSLGVSFAVFCHLAFLLGEPHKNVQVQNLVDALYRFVGMLPDPPAEFDGFFKDYKDDPDTGVFAIIEVKIGLG